MVFNTAKEKISDLGKIAIETMQNEALRDDTGNKNGSLNLEQNQAV